MLLGVIPRFSFGFLGFLEGNRKKEEKNWKSGQEIGFLRHSVGNPRRGIALHHSMGCPRHGEVGVPKWHPSGTLRHSVSTPQRSATPRRRHCSQRAIFGLLF